jgi:hypothetical protein
MLQQEDIDSLLNCLLTTCYIDGVLESTKNNLSDKEVKGIVKVQESVQYLTTELKNLYRNNFINLK